MTWLIATALRLRAIVLALAVVVIVLGLGAVRTAPYDVFPEFAPPLVEVQTEAPGLSAEEVEALVTVPLESALNGTAWLQTLRSKSVLGLSSVVLIFADGTDLLRARQLAQERLAAVATRLPAVAHAPVILPPLSSTSRVLKIGMTSRDLSQMELTDLARWTVRPRLMAVPGVANVAIWGQRDRQLQVLVDPDRLHAHGVTLEAVQRAAGNAVAVSGGGFLDTPNQRLALRHLVSVLEPDDLARTVVTFRDGVALRLGDVATVVSGSPPPIGDAVVNDRPGLLLVVEKQPWGNTLAVTRRVHETLDTLAPGLAGVQFDPTIFRPATFIERSLANLRRAMLIGCLLVVLVLVAFLFDWRTALISLTAIPLSILGAILTLRTWGGTLDTMVLAGLVVAVGEVVDDAIIDVENIARRLRLNAEAGSPLSPFQVVQQASLEVRSAVVFASVIVVLVFVPVFFLPGVAGAFFRPLGMAYVLAILASLLVALTVTPALALMLLPGAVARHEGPLARALRRRYRALLPRIVHRPRRAVLILAVASAATALAFPFLGEEFLPRFKETDFLMHWVGKPGASLEAMRRLTLRVSEELRAVPGVRNFGAHIGRAEAADEVVGPNFAELWISIDENVDYDETLGRIQEIVAGYPGLFRDVLTYLRERIKEVLTGASATLVIRVYGPDLAVLRDQAREIGRAVADVPGLANLRVEPQVLVPQVAVRVRAEAATVYGLTPADVRRAVTTLVQGSKVGEAFEEQRVVEVVVWGAEAVRRDLHALADAAVETPTGGFVPLRQVADLAIEPAPNEIRREAASRRIDVLADVGGTDLRGVARAVEERVRALPFPRGYHPEFLGEYAASVASRNRLLGLAGLSLAGILLVLHADFRSLRVALLVFLTLPFASIGGVLAAFAAGRVLSLGSLVGLVTVLGIAARNAIMLVSHYRHLEQVEGEPFGVPLVIRGAEERLAPILMTALSAALALVPLVVAGHIPGHEIEHPMAVVILGGLASSTALNLLLLPTFYAALGRPMPDADH
jgi:CzcA family heavy metal efflux pump